MATVCICNEIQKYGSCSSFSDDQIDELMCFQSDVLTVSLWESMLRCCFEDEGSKSVWEWEGCFLWSTVTPLLISLCVCVCVSGQTQWLVLIFNHVGHMQCVCVCVCVCVGGWMCLTLTVCGIQTGSGSSLEITRSGLKVERCNFFLLKYLLVSQFNMQRQLYKYTICRLIFPKNATVCLCATIKTWSVFTAWQVEKMELYS